MCLYIFLYSYRLLSDMKYYYCINIIIAICYRHKLGDLTYLVATYAEDNYYLAVSGH